MKVIFWKQQKWQVSMRKLKLPEMVSMESIENHSIVFGNCPSCRHVGILAIGPSGPHSLNLNHRPILNWKETKDDERAKERERGRDRQKEWEKRGNKNEIQWQLYDKMWLNGHLIKLLFGQLSEWEFSEIKKNRIDYRHSATPRHATRKIMSCNYWIGERFLTSFSFRWVFASLQQRLGNGGIGNGCEKWKWNATLIMKNNYLVWRTPPRLWSHSKL